MSTQAPSDLQTLMRDTEQQITIWENDSDSNTAMTSLYKNIKALNGHASANTEVRDFVVDICAQLLGNSNADKIPACFRAELHLTKGTAWMGVGGTAAKDAMQAIVLLRQVEKLLQDGDKEAVKKCVVEGQPEVTQERLDELIKQAQDMAGIGMALKKEGEKYAQASR